MKRFFIPSAARDPYRFDMPLEGHFHIAKMKGILYEADFLSRAKREIPVVSICL
jgi:hypothetical protein